MNKALFPVLLLYFLINLWVVSSWTCWWYAGGSFSQRSMLSSYVLMAIPLGYFIVEIQKMKKLWKAGITLIISLLLLLNIFQTWQWAHGIIDRTRMTREYYVAIFGKTHSTDIDRSLLLIDRAAMEILPANLDNFQYRQLDFHTYDDPNEYTGNLLSDTSFSGKFALKADPSAPFVAGVELPYKEITEKEYAWIRVSILVYPLKPLEETQASLVASVEHNGEPYKYKAESISQEKYHIKPGTWTKVSFDYLTPEVRSSEDKLKVYFWVQGKSPLLIDDFMIESWEPEE